MLKKCLIALFAVIAVSALYAAPKQIKIAQGAACYVWNQDVVNKPESVPAGGFVDTATEFAAKIICSKKGLGRLDGCFFAMWEGFIKVPRTDNYRFTLVSAAGANVRVFINGKTLITRRVGDKATVTASAHLTKGMVKVRFYFNSRGWSADWFNIQFGRATGMKMTYITPATMYHQVDDEEE